MQDSSRFRDSSDSGTSLELKRKRLILQLQNHGLANLEKLNYEQLVEQFQKVSADFVREMADFNLGIKQKSTATLEIIDGKIKAKLKDAEDYYATFNELLVSYPYANIYEVAINSLPSQVMQKALLILEIKYRQYQEILIERIEKKVNFMPREECAGFMNFIERKRDEVELLKDILAQLESDKIASMIDRTTNMKRYILGEFMPSDMEKNYKQFYNASKDKQELISRLRKISNAYSKKQLDDMTKEDLMEILNSIRQRELDDKKDKEDFEKYLALFKKAMFSDNSSEFDALVIQVLEDISADCLANLKAHLKNVDPLFENKFSSAQKEWNKLGLR